MNPWSNKEEIERLVRLHQKGLTYQEIADCLERTHGSIKSMIFRIQSGEYGLKKFTNKVVPWYQQDDAVIGHLDIESDNLKANFGHVLSWAIKIHGTDEIRYSIMEPGEFSREGEFDRRVCAEFVEAIKDIDAVTTYYGTRFDIPFLRTRCMYWGLRFPAYNGLYHWDLYYKVKSKLNLHRKSLEVACAHFGIEGKTHLDPQQWELARVGDKKALEYVLDHNIEDVKILEELFTKMEPHSKWTKRSV